MTTPDTITAWAIKAPDGEIMLNRLGVNKPVLKNWEIEFGRTCVRVEIREVP